MYLYELFAKRLKEITCTQYFIIIQTSIVITYIKRRREAFHPFIRFTIHPW
jgi:hypothetical protein